eukprot:3449337-Rhodomonas_salina.2
MPLGFDGKRLSGYRYNVSGGTGYPGTRATPCHITAALLLLLGIPTRRLPISITISISISATCSTTRSSKTVGNSACGLMMMSRILVPVVALAVRGRTSSLSGLRLLLGAY